MNLTPNSTIADVLSSLHSPEAYLKGIVRKMQSCIDLHGNAQVTIGIDGSGKFPCYRILYTRQLADGSSEEVIANSFIDSHKPFPAGYELVVSDSWSKSRATLGEVEGLLADVKAATQEA